MNFPIIIAILFSLNANAQHPDAIVGKWIKANKEDLIIEVYKTGQEYRGKVTWSKDNSKPTGFIMLEQLRFNEADKEWEDGKINDPKSGRSYDATVKMKADGTLEVSGGMLFIKVKRIFRRVT